MKIRFLLVTACLLAGGCTNGVPAGSGPVSPSASAPAWLLYAGQSSGPDPDRLQPGEVSGPSLVVSGTFRPFRPGATAITYDPAVVPPGARARVAVTRTPTGLIVRLTAAGLVPRLPYGVQLHTGPCTASASQSGPVYRHTPAASDDPADEVILDLTADTAGAGTAVSQVNWVFDGRTPPRSIVFTGTRTAAGPGAAPARAACLTLTGP